MGIRLESLPPKKRAWYLPDLQEYRVIAEYPVNTRYGKIIIPCGFVTDLASAEVLKWFLAGSNEAAVIHDLLYRIPNLRNVAGAPITRDMADDIFKDELRKAGLSRWKFQACWLAVRILGANSWIE